MDSQFAIHGQLHFALRRLDDLDLGRHVGIDVDMIADRPADVVPIDVGEEHRVLVVLGLPGVVGGQRQLELADGLRAGNHHRQDLQTGTIQIDPSRFDRHVGCGIDRHLRAFQRPDVALTLDRAVGQFGIGREVVVDAVDGDRGGDVEFKRVLLGRGIARRETIGRVLLKAFLARRQFATIVVGVIDTRHGHPLVDHLAVGGADQEGHLFAVAESGDRGDDRLVIVVEHAFIARRDLFNVDPRGSRHARPGPEHPRRGNEGIFRRKGQVQGEDRHHPGQHAGQVYDAAPVHRMVGRHLQQIGRRPMLHRPVDHRRDILRVRTKQKEVDETVLERWPALFDGLRGENWIDAIGQRRHQETPDEGPCAGDPDGKKPQPGQEAKSVAEDPLVQEGDNQKEEQRGCRQQHEAGSHVHQPHLPAGMLQAILDEIFVSPCPGGVFRLRTSGNYATCHDGSPYAGLLVFLTSIIDGIARSRLAFW